MPNLLASFNRSEKSILEQSLEHSNYQYKYTLCEMDLQNKVIKQVIENVASKNDFFYLMVRPQSRYFIIVEINYSSLFKSEELSSIRILNPEFLTFDSVYNDGL